MVPSLRRVVYGGGPIDPGLAAAAIERFGPVFVQLYGMGESPMTITYLRPQDHRGKALSSAGIARTDVEVRLVDESGAAVAEGSEGEVCVRGDVVMSLAGTTAGPMRGRQARAGCTPGTSAGSRTATCTWSRARAM